MDLARKEISDLQEKSTRLESTLRDFREQIEADDRVDKLEASLKSLQDRSNSLESQLAKTKQVRSSRINRVVAHRFTESRADKGGKGCFIGQGR